MNSESQIIAISGGSDAVGRAVGTAVGAAVDGGAKGGAWIPKVATLVERFDIEPYSDFSAKRANFIGLVLFCINAKFCKKIFVGKLLTRSTRITCFCTAQTSIFQQNFDKNLGVSTLTMLKSSIFSNFVAIFAD